MEIIDRISKWLNFVSQVLLGFIVLLISIDVFGRWLFSSPVSGSVELIQQTLIIIIFFSLSYTHLKDEHITIGFIVENLTKKAQKIYDIIINIVIMIILSLIGLSLIGNASRLYSSNTVTSDLGIPVFIFSILATVGIVSFVLIAFRKVIGFLKGETTNDS